MTLSCASQLNLSKAISESKNETINLSYIDSSGKGYERGLIGGMRMKVIFRNIEFTKQANLIKVEGVAAVFFNEKDRVGLSGGCDCVAQPVKGYLTKIRKLGETNSSQLVDASKPDGYFSFEITVDKEDRLYFISRGGTGLEEYDIGKVCFKISPITKEKTTK